ncbi:MAG: Zn-ribbon domain-containing OB-fold protein [Acidimicrobiales bacterium]
MDEHLPVVSPEIAVDEHLPVVIPEIGADNAPFWAAAADDRLVLPWCRSCNTAIWYPRTICPTCHGRDIEWREASGRGVIHSFTVSYRGTGPWAEHVPYLIAYVELDEGPRVLTNIVGAVPHEVRIGDPVEAIFEPAGDTRILRFRPAAN